MSGAENAEGGQHQEDEAGHAAEGSEAREVHLTPEQRELLSVQTVTVPRGRADNIVTAPAEVHYVPDRVAEVGPLLQGKLTRLAVDLGDQVEKGQLLATLNSVVAIAFNCP